MPLGGGGRQEVGDDGFWGFEGLDHFLMMAPALDGRSGADMFAEHPIEMIFSFLEGVGVDKLEEGPEEVHILAIFQPFTDCAIVHGSLDNSKVVWDILNIH